ncbi:protein kinase domain-containing protein [Streptomyces profundus]|uniref:serine/threonine-protein kinase n=1 Tax=Streptomyces profundus TaxID=2867410 RepID=UPI001D16A050|nr:PQQ-binding-like beta-propeller repeat protein [Streptomyces sp. MA3_2.13]UED87484.1 serine/threonine-protein kinase [Streptomyces sp. MA3_2.13]
MRRQPEHRAGGPRPLTAADPALVGGWTPLARLGAGGAGVVYLARDDQTRLAALKVPHRDDAESLLRLASEARTLELLDAAGTLVRGVPGRLDAALEGPAPHLATTYLPGPTLRRCVESAGPLPEPALRRCAVSLVDTVLGLHATGTVHRDVKPSNVLLTADGPRLVDFGIARASGTAPPATPSGPEGSPGYTPPERGEAVTDEAEDVFGCAATLAFAATGRDPFGIGTPDELAYRVRHSAPDLTGAPAAVRAVLEAGLAADPAARPSLAELGSLLGEAGPLVEVLPASARQELRAFADTDWARLPPLRDAPPASSDPRRRALLLGAAGFGGVAATGFAGHLLGRRARSASTPRLSFAPAAASDISARERWARAAEVPPVGRAVLADGAIFVPGLLSSAFDGRTGELLWSRRGLVGNAPVAVDEGRLLAHHQMVGGGGQQLGLTQTRTGRSWASRPLGIALRTMRATPVVGSRGAVLFVTGLDPSADPEEAEAERRPLLAYDTAGDEVLWSTTFPAVGGDEVAGAVSDGVVLVLAADSVHGFDADSGAELWTRELGAELTDDSWTGMPSRRVVTDGAGRAAVTGRGILVLNAADGSTIWSVEPDSDPDLAEASEENETDGMALYGAAAFAGDSLFLAEARWGVRALATADRSALWQWEAEDPFVSPPAGCLAAGGLVFPPAGQFDTAVTALDAATGEVAWHLRDGEATGGDPQLLADDTGVYLLRNDRLRALAL